MQLFGGGARFLTEKDMANTSVGVNLYQGTKDFSGTNWVFDGTHSKVNPYSAIKNAYLDFTALEVNVPWGGVRQDILANSGETYTFSGFIKKGNGNPNVVFYGDAQGITNIGHVDSEGKSINITDSWSRFSITFTVATGGIIQPRIESNNGGPNVTYFIAGLKLERGAVPTQWCPAPEDYVAKSDFDKKINVDNQIGTDSSITLPASDNWSDIFGVNTGTSWTERHNLLRVGQTQETNYFYGNSSSAIFFGGGDTKGGLEVHYQDHEARIVGGNNPKVVWSERIAWKSDIQKLEQEISDLKKQIDQLKQGK